MPEESPLVHRFGHQAMGTTFEAIIAGHPISYAAEAAQAAFAEVERMERLFSRFDTSSEISQVNRLGPGQAMAIGIETYECLTIAERVRLETGGAFDINFRGLQRSSEPERKRRARMVLSASHGFWVAREGEPAESTLDLDLGGIGKGYALDRVAEVLSDWGVDRFLFHAGTSTALARGDGLGLAAAKRGWPVGAGGHSASAIAPDRLLLRDRALSGSGSEVKGGHIVDPRRAQPVSLYLGVWVSHPRATEADALSTAFMVMTFEEIEFYCELHPEVWALVLTPDRRKRVFHPEIFV